MSNTMLVAPVVVSTPPRKNHLDYGSKVVTAEPPVKRGDREFWLDGSVVISGIAALRTADLEICIPQSAAEWEIQQIADWWAMNAKNPGALYIHDNNEGWSACLPDPLGGALAFTLQRDGHVFVSTSTTALTTTAEDHGFNLTKDPLFQIERLLLGNGGLINNSFENVHGIEPFQYVYIADNQAQTRAYKSTSSLMALTNFELFQMLRNEVLSTISALVNSKSAQVISHLTGGFDSRIVLSAILHLGVEDRTLLFCSGPEGSTDRVIADGLSRQFGLRRASGAGLTPAPTTNMSERLMGPLFASGGITNTGPLGREVSANVIAMGGGYGEVLRTFYGNREITSEGTLSDELILKRYLPFDSPANKHISPAAISTLGSNLIQNFRRINTIYDDPEFLGDAYYTHTRNRYHIGQSSLLWSRIGSRFDPLYSLAGFELSRRATQSTRAANEIGHDLMESFSSKLLEFPFDYERFSDELQKRRKKPVQTAWPSNSRKISFEESVQPESVLESKFLNALSGLDIPQPHYTTAQRQAMTAQANQQGVNFWQIMYKTTGQELLRKAFETSPSSPVYEFIDPNYIKSIASKSSLNKRELRDLYSLGSIITWCSLG